MELVIHWFWLVKLATLLIALFVGYKAFITHRNNSVKWNIAALVTAILMVVSPVKMAPTIQPVIRTMDMQIDNRHTALPAMVVDNSFNEANLSGILAKDLK